MDAILLLARVIQQAEAEWATTEGVFVAEDLSRCAFIAKRVTDRVWGDE